MALVQKKNKEKVKEPADTKAGASAEPVVDKVAEAQAKIAAAKEGGATAGSAAKEPEKASEPEPEGKTPTPDTKEVAPKAAGALGKPVGKVNRLFEDRVDQMVAPYGTFPRIKTGSGDFVDGEGVQYGTWLLFEMLSYNELFVVSPNSDSKDKAVQEEEKAAIRYSYDGVNLDDGTGTVADYIEALKPDWPGCTPSVKNYRECVGILHNCDKAAVAEDVIGQMVQLQLAPSSRNKHEGHIMAMSFHVHRGIYTEDEAAMMKIKAKSASGGGYNWTNFTFGPGSAE